MKSLKFILMTILLSNYLSSQTVVDWVDMEILAKRRQLERRWELEKRVSPESMNDYDVVYYLLNLKIDIPNKVLIGTVKIRGKSLIDNLTHIDLNFYSNMEVKSVFCNALSFIHEDDLLTLNLSESFSTYEIFEVGVEYEGTPVQSGFMGFSFDEHNGVPVVSTLSEPYFARTWFPCKDIPQDKADSADIIITVPDTLIAVSNGVLKDVLDNGDGTKTYFWHESYPITTYLISLAVSNYLHWSDSYVGLDSTIMPVDYWVFPEYYSTSYSTLSLTPQMISFFSSLWGEYPFILEKYGQAQFPWGGGMEHQTCTSLGGFGEMLICHELAHQWWGDMITCANWHHIWLNEGFARYSEALWYEHKYGTDGLKWYMERLNRPEYWGQGSVYVVDTTSVYSIFDLIVYDKGAWVLHMLRKVLGEEMYWSVLHRYRETFNMGVATTDDFQLVCETVSGLDLNWFFEQWIYGTGQPFYRVTWEADNIQGEMWKVDATIEQIQTTSTIFKMPIDILIQTQLYGDTVFTILDSLEYQEFEFLCYGQPVSLELDPECWVLKRVEYLLVDSDAGSLPDDFVLLPPYPNPFNNSTFFKMYLPEIIDGEIAVYDVTGRKVDIIEEGVMRPGYHIKEWRPSNLSSGLYFIRLSYGFDHLGLQRKVTYLK